MVAIYHIAEGDQNSLGQYLIARARTFSADNRLHLNIACIHCGTEYVAAEVNFHNCRCPSCQDGSGHNLI